MAYRNKTYVCFDADTDMHYYNLMRAWKQNDNTTFDFYNAHDLNKIWQRSKEDTIKVRLRERLKNTKVFVVLIGLNTKQLYKFVRWEMEQALKLGLPIVSVNLNGNRKLDRDLWPPIIRSELAIHISFKVKIFQYALEDWESSHRKYRSQGKSGDYFYTESLYNKLGL